MVKLLPLWLLPVFVLVHSQFAFSQCNIPFPPSTGPQGCANAPTFCSTAAMDNYCSSTGPTGVGPCPPMFCAGCQNNQWFNFVAGSSNITIQINPSNCSLNSQGLQAEIYQTTNCVNFTSVSNCETPGTPVPITVTSNSLVPGQTYYLMIDGWAGDICDYTIDVLAGTIGSPGPPVIPGIITGPMNVCPGAVLNYSVPPGAAIGNYDWSLTPAIGIIGNDGSNNITITFTGPGVAQLCVTPSNDCATGTTICKTIISTPIAPQFEFITFCFGDTWTCQGQTFSNPGQQTFVYDSWLGCDSTRICVATALPPIVMPPFQAVICQGQSYNFAGNTYNATGGYPVTLVAANGCDSVVTLILLVMQANAVIAPPGVLGCGGNSTLVLNGSGSTTTAASGRCWPIRGRGRGLSAGQHPQPDDQFGRDLYFDCNTNIFRRDLHEPSLGDGDFKPGGAQPANRFGPLESLHRRYVYLHGDTTCLRPCSDGLYLDGDGRYLYDQREHDHGDLDGRWSGPGMRHGEQRLRPRPGSLSDHHGGPGPAVPTLTGPATVCEGDVINYVINPWTPVRRVIPGRWEATPRFTDLGSSIQVDFPERWTARSV
ncbi:MAG: hypothetical protein IPJ00_11410 [Saprospirales bacterium]|nr:hypothetical protein [Saprospirales bacterium]